MKQLVLVVVENQRERAFSKVRFRSRRRGGTEVRGQRIEVRKPRKLESSQSAYAGQSPSAASTTASCQFLFAGIRSVESGAWRVVRKSS